LISNFEPIDTKVQAKVEIKIKGNENSSKSKIEIKATCEKKIQIPSCDQEKILQSESTYKKIIKENQNCQSQSSKHLQKRKSEVKVKVEANYKTNQINLFKIESPKLKFQAKCLRLELIN